MDERIAVSFPNLGNGIDFNISNVAFRVFNIPIYWYGIIIASAFLVCVLWAMKDSTKFDLVPDTIIDLMLFAAPAAIICARIYYVIFSWDKYSSSLKEIFNTRNGGLAIYGGIIGAVITAYLVARYKKIPALKLFDFAIPYVALGQAIGRWGNFFNQEAFGTNTSLPWGMTSPVTKAYLSNHAQELQQQSGITVYPDLPVHPTFLYESILDLAVFVFLIWMRKKKKFNGEVFCFYFLTYSLGRAFIEGLRTDSLMLGSLRVSQLLSVLFVIAFGIFIIYKRAKIKNESLEQAEAGHSIYAGILKDMEKESLEEEKLNEKAESDAVQSEQEPEAGDEAD
ncbi:phosphatidylglycerol:prolipoprotein diacylglycerol transferase [Ruminiclostridium sufflavum DSM 19573]|uniref:Phosphatidylglycerol--prolipoprotein diacylglyceryl transferase n=1 Tax=Ruminiclostridium sufflavum DSM 19573 TaxID=1121337 RepID=A0A318XZI6_9FIRM|nr:prolipoprotein diacylglyceryl transferase [Ruminiclostridium sufflavum]PYG88430.1 phosphatidylglycerol:prolipoprotein diacylglycerol transferase [Ruminiclostridium sufflavum DSM 19573]